jgi:hypothetical protein
MECAAPKPRLQFTLRHTLLGVGLVNVFLGSVVWAGLFGAVLFAQGCGAALLYLGWRKRNHRYFVPGVLLALAAGSLLLAGSTVATGVGRSLQPCTFQVVDQESGGAVSGATVRIRNLRHEIDWMPRHPIPPGEPGISGVTDGSGRVVITCEFPYSDKTSLFINQAHIGIQEYYWLQIEAPRYERRVVRLDSFYGDEYDYFKLPLPTRQIELTRQP